jgi:predicted alpha/beta superfamily hydrolase
MQKFLGLFLFIFSFNWALAQITLKVKDLTHCNKKIYLAGNVNGWDPKNDSYSLFSVNGYHYINLTPEGILEFKFTQGSWSSAEGDSIGKQISNRKIENYSSNDTIELTINGWEFNKPKTSTKSENVISENYFLTDSSFSFHPEIWVYLPKSYQKSKITYPVVYLMDGQNLFDDALAYSGEWGIDELLDSSNLEVIVVAIANGGANRMLEYSPWKNEKYDSGKGIEYADFLVKNVMPFFENKYRISKSRDSTFIGGSSLGALICHYAFIKYNSGFGGIINFSPAFWFNPEIFHFSENQDLLKNSKFYFASGEQESDLILNAQEEMVNLLKNKPEAKLNAEIRLGEKHNEQFWHKEFLKALMWILK